MEYEILVEAVAMVHTHCRPIQKDYKCKVVINRLSFGVVYKDFRTSQVGNT